MDRHHGWLARMKSGVSDVAPVERVMLTDFQALPHDDPLFRATERTLAGSQKAFPVLLNGGR